MYKSLEPFEPQTNGVTIFLSVPFLSKKRESMKSKERHIIDGTYRPSRHSTEPSFPNLSDIPDPPDRLSVKESEYWYRYTSELDRMGLLSSVFLTTLVDLCRVEVLKDELLIKSTAEDSAEKINRVLRDAFKAQELVLKLRGKLGLTPADKRKIAAPSTNIIDDGFDDL